MNDQSSKDRKYFVDNSHYNCPFCNRNHIPFGISSVSSFDWDNGKKCHTYIIQCKNCDKESLHLTWYELDWYNDGFQITLPTKDGDREIHEIDELFFHHRPTSFFTMDSRINHMIRELIVEAEDCLKMNLLTGGSACLRKAIYELLKAEGIDSKVGEYDNRIKALKKKFEHLKIDPSYFDVLGHIKDMTSDKVHEESWKKYDSHILRELIEITKSVLYEIYVLPDQKKQRVGGASRLLEMLRTDKKKPKDTVQEQPQQPN
jgi:transcription elongation factor Elf1